MPSRFLTLWSMLSKPAGQQQSPPKKKNKKDTQTPQVHYRTGSVAPIIPVYGELDVEDDVVPQEISKTPTPPPPPPKQQHTLPPSGSNEGVVKLRVSSRRSKSKADIDVDRKASQSTLTRSASVFRRSFFRSKSVAPPPPPPVPTVTKNHQSVESLAHKNRRDDPLYQTSRVTKSLSVGGLSQRSLRVCQAKRVAPPIVPNSESASLSSSQQLHRHSGSSFDSGGSAESSSGGYCSATGSLSSCHVASSSSAWSSSGAGGSAADQRSSIGLDDTFLPPPPPASPRQEATVLHHKHHMYSRGESESVYSGRNLGSPGFGGPGGIFTYPANGIYGQIGQHQRNRSGSSGSSQPSSPHVYGSTTIMMEREPSALGTTTTASTVLLPHPNYSHQMSLEDQGIDLTQSPGRESPSSSSSTVSVGIKSNNSSSGASSAILPGSGSSCRHSTTSTTSLDSGRASGSFSHHHGQPALLLQQQQHQPQQQHHHLQQTQQQHQQRFSGQSYESCLRNSYHSSSSSLGSSNGSKIDDIHRLNICEMLSQGVPEHEILNAWLTDLGFEEYYDVFVQSGYDMHTITRMTPEDLTAIGIQKPNHRKKLKSEIALLQIPDGLPDFIPDTLEEWLALLGLAEYSPSLRRQGYRTVEDVTQLTWEDLEDFGILRLGHQKKITLAIKRVKDILAGKYVPMMHMETSFNSSTTSPDQPHHHHNHPEPLSSFQQQQQPYRPPSAASSHYAIPPSVMRPVYFPQPQQQQQQQHYNHYQQQQQQPIYYQYQKPTYQPDVVAIQVHRNRSSEDVRICPPAPATEPVQQQTFYKPGWRQRSYEDGDVTPVSENGHHPQQSHVPGGGTLPRPRGTVKPRPVAKISAKTRSDCCPLDANDDLKAQQPQYGTLSKRHPPPAPPKRNSSSSISSADAVGLTVESDPIYGRNAKSSPLPLPPPPPVHNNDSMNLLSYSDDSEDFPPPPAPITASDSYLQHGQHSSSAAASVRERLDNILQRSGAGHWPARPHSQQSGNYGVPTISRSSTNSMSGLKMVGRECSPSDSIETSDTEPGSPAMDGFRQRRNGSDASFKSTSSTESDSMPFANDNAGTIKQRNARTHPALAALNYSSLPSASVLSPSLARRAATNSSNKSNLGASDVLNDIGNMLADLTDELDSMLEEESSNQPLRQKS